MTEHFDRQERVAFETAQRLSEVNSTVGGVSINWEWLYSCEIDQIRDLYRKGKLSQWNVDVDIKGPSALALNTLLLKPSHSLSYTLAWKLGKRKEIRNAALHAELKWSLSQILHGEQAALFLACQLVQMCPDFGQKLFLSTQVVDEARHCEVFSGVLRSTFQGTFPIAPYLRTVFEDLLKIPYWPTKAVGMQLIVEAIAVGMFGQLRDATTNPVLLEILRRVTQDEARHAAFGSLALRNTLSAMSLPERDILEKCALKVLGIMETEQLSAQLREVFTYLELDPAEPLDLLSRKPLNPQIDQLMRHRQEIYASVKQNLVKLGVIQA